MTKRNFICGILHLSSNISYGQTKNGIIKLFTPFNDFIYNDKKYDSFHVGTKKSYNPRDVYCVVKFVEINKEEVAIGTIESYIGEVGDMTTEKKFIKENCVCSWANNKTFDPDDYCIDLYEKNRIKFDFDKIYSIDPQKCLDIDDAIHVKKNNNEYEIGIHISDVSSYIPIDSLLDDELTHRCESLYLKDCQIDMLPDFLLRECSLTIGKEKRVMSIIIILTEEYKIKNIRFEHYMINVKQNLSYEKAQYLINNKSDQDLCLMYELGKQMIKNKTIPFETKEYDTHTMVEVYMILANIIVARQQNNKIFRSNNGPQKELYKNDENNEMIKKANMLLMSKASYTIEKNCHVGVGDIYTHYTSPIRRYIDILVHRNLSNIVTENVENKIVHINMIKNIYKKCENLSNMIDKIYELNIKNGDILIATGYVIYFDDKKVKIYVEGYDMIVTSMLYSEKLMHLVETEINNDTIILKKEKSSIQIKMKMFDKIKIQIAFTIFMKKKLSVIILEPNIRDLFEIVVDV